jgi:hypothetical protein
VFWIVDENHDGGIAHEEFAAHGFAPTTLKLLVAQGELFRPKETAIQIFALDDLDIILGES